MFGASFAVGSFTQTYRSHTLTIHSTNEFGRQTERVYVRKRFSPATMKFDLFSKRIL